jgi:hypothetical protein
MESKAREEANRIVDMFSDGANLIFENETIQCAIIHVEGIVKALSKIKDLHVIGNSLLNEIEFYQEVKQELNNML